MMELADLTACEALRRISSGTLRTGELLEACLGRIAEREATVRAFAYLDPGLARRGAMAPAGPLGGIPVGVKDVIDTADQPSQYGSGIWEGWRPRSDAWAVCATRAAGAVVLGKTVTAEFATRHPGPTTNPHDPACTPGGSSQGSAAGVAAGFFPLAIGTQTAGSIIRPAAFCGVYGFKPSYGLVHRAGMKVMSESLDTVGLMARSVEDCALFGGVLAGQDLGRGEIPGRPPRFALCWGPGEASLEAATRDLLLGLADRCRRAGATVDIVAMPADVAAVREAHPVVMHGETWKALGWERMTAPTQLSAVLRETLAKAEAISGEELRRARLSMVTGRRAFAAMMDGYDVVMTPSAPGEAPKGLDSTGNSICNAVWTSLHGPCITVPAGHGPRGLPLGVQLVGLPGQDGPTLCWAVWLTRFLAS